MVKNIIIMGMEKDKLITQLDAILPTTVHFKKEYLAITKIRDFINTVADDKFKRLGRDRLFISRSHGLMDKNDSLG